MSLELQHIQIDNDSRDGDFEFHLQTNHLEFDFDALNGDFDNKFKLLSINIEFINEGDLQNAIFSFSGF